jgi:hypothetical protein
LGQLGQGSARPGQKGPIMPDDKDRRRSLADTSKRLIVKRNGLFEVKRPTKDDSVVTVPSKEDAMFIAEAETLRAKLLAR